MFFKEKSSHLKCFFFTVTTITKIQLRFIFLCIYFVILYVSYLRTIRFYSYLIFIYFLLRTPRLLIIIIYLKSNLNFANHFIYFDLIKKKSFYCVRLAKYLHKFASKINYRSFSHLLCAKIYVFFRYILSIKIVSLRIRES